MGGGAGATGKGSANKIRNSRSGRSKRRGNP